MKENQLNKFIIQLGLEETVFFRDKDYGNTFIDFHSDVQKKLDIIQPDAFYVFNNQPLILFFDLTEKPDSDREKEIHKQVWSFDNSPIIFVVKNTDIKIYNALNYNKEKGSLEEIVLTDSERNEKFSFWNLQSGSTWKWLQQDYLESNRKKENRKRVNERLFQNIRDVREALINEEEDPTGSIPNSLILRLIFIRYLIDRGINIDGNFISGINLTERRQSLSELIKNPVRLGELFHKLNENFNGVLFREVNINLSTEQAKALSQVFRGEIPEEGTLFDGKDFYFDIFDFSIIPVEVISGIYESLIDPETRNLHSAVYTPSFLVEYILNDTVDEYLRDNSTSECKIFEVAVGSGIFLVQSLRKMIEKEIELNGNSDKQLFSERIREIVKNNLFGIDINKEALKVTCFSIYIALLDFQEPKDVEKYPFPNLIDENLFEANFFDTEHQYNKTIKEKEPNYILGNPPWKSNKDEFHLKWLKENKKTVGRFEIAQSFLLRTKDFMQSHTKSALIVTSTIFYNVSNPTKKFKNEFLTTFCIDKFFDLSPVRRLIFEEKSSPASVVYFRLSKDNSHLNNVIKHQSVKSNSFLKHFKILVIEKFDQKRISQHHFIENDWMFKMALYGNTLDFNLLKKISLSKTSRIIDLIDSKVSFKGAGIERGKEVKYYPELIGMPVIENSEIKQDFLKLQERNILNENDVHLSRGRDKNIFLGKKILFKEQNYNESEPLISYIQEDAVFRKGIFSIASKEDRIIKTLYSYFKSNLNTYYLFLISAAWGVGTRPAIRFEEELLSFPFIKPKEDIENKLVELVNQFFAPYRKFYKTEFTLGNPERDESVFLKINDIINDLYRITEHEKDLINYVLDVSRYQFQESKQEKFTRKVGSDKEFLENYADVYLKEFEDIYQNEFIQVEIYPLEHFIALNFVFMDSCPKEKIIYPNNNNNEKEVLKRLAYNLSISQVTDTKDPTKNLFIQKDIKGFEQNSFYIIKPNEYKCWHRAMAWYDVAEFKEAIEVAELDSLKDQVND